MTNLQRMNNDIATMDKREMADKITVESRNKNDMLTQERRFEADESLKKNREKNDEITAERRIIKDENPNTVIALTLGLMIVLGIGIFFIFI